MKITIFLFLLTNKVFSQTIIPTSSQNKKELSGKVAAAYLGSSKPIWLFRLKKDQIDLDKLNDYLYSYSTSGSFQNMNVQLGKNTFIGTEFAHFFFGVMRLGIGGYFQASGDTTADNNTKTSLQKLITNGGNLSLNSTLPILFTRSSNEHNHFGTFAFLSLGLSSSNKFLVDSAVNFTGQMGINFHADFASNDANKNAQITFDLPYSYVFGSKAILDKIGLPDFSVLQFRASLVFSDLLSLYLQYPIISTSSIVNNNYRQLTAGLQFSPSKMLAASAK